jgi:hypothetical protein
VSNVRFFNKILAGEKTFKSCLKKKKWKIIYNFFVLRGLGSQTTR